MTGEGGGDAAGASTAASARTVREVPRRDGHYPLFVHPEWEEEFPGLAAGVTAAGRGADGEPADFGLTTAPSPWALFRRFDRLGGQLGFPAAAVGRQVHGAAVTCLSPTPEPGLRIPGETDGLISDGEGLLLTVTAADCVPVYAVDPGSGGLGIFHAGWRGIAAGVLEAGLRAMRARFGCRPSDLRVHLGPAICGACYEVGEEVVRALDVDDVRDDGTGRPGVDLRGVLAARARELGADPGAVTRSAWCTRCSADHFHSHRGTGDEAGRMAAFLGWRRRGSTG